MNSDIELCKSLEMTTTKYKFGFAKIESRTLISLFLALSILVLTNIFITSLQTYSFGTDVSLRVKSDISSALNNILNFNTEKNISKTTNQLIPSQKTYDERPSNQSPRYHVVAQRINAVNLRLDRKEINGSNTMKYDIFGNPLVQGATNHSDNTRKDECDNCFNHDFKYLINNPDICKLYRNQKELELLILILTVHSNILERNALRETWLTYGGNNSADVRYAFLFGEIPNATSQENLYRENEQYKDIIQENFVDTYSNLTYKTMMGFKWATSYCGAAKALLKTDDDMYINVPNVLKIVKQELISLQTNIIGSCNQVAAPIRNSKSKWFASLDSYPGKYYAGFCSGTGYLMSLNVARQVFKVSHHVPFFHLEDVYVALCIKKLGYHLKAYPGFHPDHPKLDPCLYNGNALVTSHYMTPDQTRKMWKEKCTSTSKT